MADKPKPPVVPGELTLSPNPPAQTSNAGFLERSLERLPEEKRDSLLTTAIENRIELDQKKEEAIHQTEINRVNMHDAVRQAEEFKGTGLDGEYEYKGGGEGFEWSARVEARPAKNSMILVVGIVAIVALAFALIFK